MPDEQATQYSDTGTAPISITVPAAHESLFKRILTLLERGEQDIIDNIHAGIIHFENLAQARDNSEEGQQS
jgi:hypothetical protein